MSVETEQKTETYSWLLAEEYLAQLEPNDIRNIKAVLEFVNDLPGVKEKFENGQAAVFAVGSSAIPKSLFKEKPKDIDLKLVIQGVSLLDLIDTIRDRFKISNLRGIFKNWYYQDDYEAIEGIDVFRFFPYNGRTIDLFFEKGQLVEYLDHNENRLRKLAENLAKKPPSYLTQKAHRKITLTNAFIVRLA